MLGILAISSISPQVGKIAWRFACGVLGGALISCGGGSRVPPPQAALQRYVDAVEQADAGALRDMMTSEARSEYSVAEIRRLLRRDRREFDRRTRELSRVAKTQSGSATVYLVGGRSAELRLEKGQFWVESAGLVPEMPRTPEEAAASLKDAVAARDYAKIERTLTDKAKREFSHAFERLEQSLSQLDTAVVHVRQDEATIEFLDGRVISLKREGAAWRVESFE